MLSERFLRILIATAGIALFACGSLPIQTAGGSSDTEISGKAIVGSVVDQNGNAVANAIVLVSRIDTERAVPDGRFPTPPPPVKAPDTVPVLTDEHGNFRIPNPDTGNWAIEVNSGDSLAVLVFCTYNVADSVKKLPVDTLKPMVTISGTVIADETQSTFVSIDGINRKISIDSSGKFSIRVPAGSHHVRISPRGYPGRNRIDLPALAPGSNLDIGVVDQSTIAVPPPCRDSACDVSALRLMLSDVGLSSVPVESVAVFKDGRITELHLRHRGLRGFSAEIGRLTALRVLDAGANQMRSPVQAISLCTTLTVLRLDSNFMPYVPNTISALHDLTTLDLSNNEIYSLPISIVTLTPDTLRLGGNHLFEIPDTVAQWADKLDPNWRATQRPQKGPPGPPIGGNDPYYH